MAEKIHHLLTWDKVSQAPLIERIVIDHWQVLGELDWCLFHYDEPGKYDLADGAPKDRILTDSEVDLVQKTWAFIDSSREQAKQLNKKAKDTFADLKRTLKDPEREM